MKVQECALPGRTHAEGGKTKQKATSQQTGAAFEEQRQRHGGFLLASFTGGLRTITGVRRVCVCVDVNRL